VLFLSALILVVKLKLQYTAAAGALDAALGERFLVYGDDIFAGGAGHFIEGLPAVPVAAASVMTSAAASMSVAALVSFLFLSALVMVMAAALMALAVLMSVTMAAFMLTVLIIVMVAAALVIVIVVIVHIAAIVIHIIVDYLLDSGQIVGHAVQLIAQVTDSALEGIHILRDRAENIYDGAYELFFLRLLAKGKPLGETLQISYLFSS